MYYELDQLVELLLRDKVYYEVSGGGVTLSGGEPTFHIDYVSQLLRKLKEHGIHTAIIPRIPLIPDITTRHENLQAISEFIQKCGLTQCWLLPYNPLGLSKRENLGKEPLDIAQEWMSDEEEMRCKNIFSWVEFINI